MPRDVRRLEVAIERCDRLAKSQEVQRLYRAALREVLDHGRVADEAGEARANSNFKFIDWRDLAEAFDGHLIVDPQGWSPR